MKFRNRALALLLSMVMVLTFMPALAFAEAEDEAQAPAEEVTEVIETEAPQAEEETAAAEAAEEQAAAEAAAKEAEEQAAAEAAAKEAEEQAAKEAAAKAAEEQAVNDAAENADEEIDENDGTSDENMCKITIDFNGAVELGEVKQPDVVEVPVGQLFSLTTYGNFEIDDPHKVFGGWAFDANGNDPIDDDNSFYPTGDTTVYVKWDEAWTVTFDANGGQFKDYDGNLSGTFVDKIRRGDSVNTPYYKPVNGTNCVAGWSLEKNGEPVDTWDLYPENDITLYAVWKEGVQVTFKESEEADEEHTHVYYIPKGESAYYAIGGDVFYRYKEDGYDYNYQTVGWSKTPGGSTVNLDNLIIREDTVLYAVWAKYIDVYYEPVEGYYPGWEVGYSMHTSLTEGTKISNNSFDYVTVDGKSVRMTSEEVPSIEDQNKVFDRWYMDKSRTKELPADLEVTAELIDEYDGYLYLYAGYTNNAVNVTLDANGGVFSYNSESVRAYKMAEGDGIYLPKSDGGVEWSGSGVKELEGWYTDEQCTNKASYFETSENWIYTASADITLYAKWQDREDELDYPTKQNFEVGERTTIEGSATLYTYTENPEGESIVLYIDSAESADDSILSVQYDDDDECWYGTGNANGKTTILVTLKSEDGGITKTVEVDASVFDYYVWIEGEPNCFVGKAVTLTPYISNSEDNQIPSDISCRWTITESDPDGCATIKALDGGKTAELLFSEEGNVEVQLQLIKEGKVVGETDAWFAGFETFYEILVDGDTFGPFTAGETRDLKLSILKKTKDDPEGTLVDDPEFIWSYNDEDFSVVDKGNNTFNVTKNSDNDSSCLIEGYVDGSQVVAKDLWFGLADYDFYFEYQDKDFFSDDTAYTLYVNDSDISAAHSFEFHVEVPTDELDEDEDYIYRRLDNSGNKYFTSEGNMISLNGTELWNEIKGTSYSDIRIVADLIINGKVVDSYPDYVNIQEATIDYRLEEDSEILIGESVDIDRDSDGEITNAEYPYGEEFYYEITGVDVISGSSVEVETDEDGDYYYIYGVRYGESVIRITYNDYYGEEKTHTFKVSVVKEKFEVEIDESKRNEFIPDETLTLKAEGRHYTAVEEYDTKGLTYKWSVDSGEADFVKIISEDASAGTCTIGVNENFDPSLFEEDGELIDVGVELFYNGVTTGKTYYTEAEVVPYYYEITPDSVNKYTVPGSSFTYTPSLILHSMGADPAEVDENVKYTWDFDPDELTIKDAGGAEIEYGEYVFGPFKLTRKEPDEHDFTLEAYVYDSEEEDYSWVASTEFIFDEMMDLSEYTYVERFSSSKTYTGKALTQSFRIINEWYETALKSGTDYTVKYTNNVKVGKATVTITGKGKYYGTIKKTFKINPKKAVVGSTTPGKGKLTVKAKTKVSSTGGNYYQIWYRVKGTSTWKKKTTSKQSLVIKSLKKGKKYQVKIRAIKKTGSTITNYGSWSTIKISGKIK